MTIYAILVGLILLLFGRRLFWIFVGIAGFLFGLEITRMFFAAQSQWLQLAIALGSGCLGALLAMLVQRLAFTFGGFFAGVFLAIKAIPYLSVPSHGGMFWLLIIGGGIFGAVIAALAMDMAIIILTCLVGAAAIVGELPLAPFLDLIIFAILVGAGLLFQGRTWSGKKDRET